MIGKVRLDAPRVKLHLARAKITQRDLAAALGVTGPAVSYYVHGRPLWVERAMVIARLLGVDLAEIVAPPGAQPVAPQS